jgi:DNA-binding NarL/FixJ family response regulator
MSETPIRTVVADDSVLLRDGIVRCSPTPASTWSPRSVTPTRLLDAVTEHEPQLCVVDVRMPPTHTDEGLARGARDPAPPPGVAVLVLSQYVEERYAGELLPGDVSGVGYLLKDRVIASTTSSRRCGASRPAGARSTPR